jgi:hypothetical protein
LRKGKIRIITHVRFVPSIAVAIRTALASCLVFTGCSPYAVGVGSAVAPDRVWNIYEGKAGDELSARVASVFSPAEGAADRVRLFEVAGGFLVFVHPGVLRVFAKDAKPEGLRVWFLPAVGGAGEWSRSLVCPDGGIPVTSPLAFLGERENRYYFLVRCLSPEKNRSAGDRGAREWIAGISTGNEDAVYKEVGKSVGMWSAWVHGDYLVQTEYTGKQTRLTWENLKTGKSGSTQVEGQYRRGWLGINTPSEWVAGEDGLARLKEEGAGLSLEPLKGAGPAKLGRCSDRAVFARVDADRFLLVCILGGRLSVASGSLSGLEAATVETIGKTVDWTDPVFPPEDVGILEAPSKGMILVTAGQQVFGVDLQSGKVKFSLTAKSVGIIGDRLSAFETRPPDRIAFRHHDLTSGRLLSSLQSDILKESVSVLSLLFPVRSGLVIFNLATGRVMLLRSSSLPTEVTGATRVP